MEDCVCMEVDLERVQKALLAKAPERPKSTKKEFVRRLLPQIQELQQRGYTYREIAELLQAEGVALPESTLKTYVQQLTRAAWAAATPPMRLLPHPTAKS